MNQKTLVILITTVCFTCFATVWSDITDPTLPLTLSNTWSKTYVFCGRNITTNKTLNLGKYFSREQINSKIHILYKDINSGKLSYSTNGLVPIANF